MAAVVMHRFSVLAAPSVRSQGTVLGGVFKNVELTLRVQPSNLDWQFERGNQQRVNRYDQTVNSKQIQISLPFDGETTVSDRLELVTERKMGNFELSNVGWEIIDVSGYAIEK